MNHHMYLSKNVLDIFTSCTFPLSLGNNTCYTDNIYLCLNHYVGTVFWYYCFKHKSSIL